MRRVGVGRGRGPFRLLGKFRQQLSERVRRERGHILRLTEHIINGQETLRTSSLAFKISGYVLLTESDLVIHIPKVA